jgi:tRNA threonylcarbamoyladenosine biosynthesis protein TsaB
MDPMNEPWLVIETSGRGGAVGLAWGGELRTVALDPARRHNRDLAPAVAKLLADHSLHPRQVRGVTVGIGPGSYTGLRVGIMSAKAFAWATGCPLVPVPTFHAIVEPLAEPVSRVAVVADALQGMAYVQTFHRSADRWEPTDQLRIERVTDWAATLPEGLWVTGPGVAVYDAWIRPELPRVPMEQRYPTVMGLWRAGRSVPPIGEMALVGLEPLYLRGSSAEEKAKLIAESGPAPG